MSASLLVFQILTGTLVGTVRDETSGVLPGVTATLSSSALPGGPSIAATSAEGRFRFPALPPGLYDLTLELGGFRTEVERGLRVSLGATLETNATLKLASVAETVNVSSDTPLLDSTEPGHSTHYGVEYAENLPLHRDSFFDLLKSAPGMSAALPGNKGDQVSAFGSSANENLYLVDGTNFTGKGAGGAVPWLDPDVVEEIQIVGLGGSAEYGEFQGAVFNVVTKSGGSDFRFDASYYSQFDALTSQPTRIPCDCLEGESGYVRDHYNDFSAHAGGPLWKDRIWFFGGYNLQLDGDSLPGADSRSPSAYDTQRVFFKINWQITPNLKLMVNYHDDLWDEIGNATLSRPYEVLVNIKGHNPSITFFHLTHLVSASTLWEARVSGYYGTGDWFPTTENLGPYHEDVLTGIASGGPWLIGPGTWRRTDGQGKLSHYATDFLSADHDFKFGVQLGFAKDEAVGVIPFNARYFDYGGYPYYAIFRDPYAYGGASRSLGLFAEDVARVGERLTLSLGLRYDHLWSFSPDLPAVDKAGNETGETIEGDGTVSDWSELSPRIGLTYKLTFDGKTLLRANWGRFRQGVFLSEPAVDHPALTPITNAYYDPATGRYSDVISVVDPTTQLGLDPDVKGPLTDEFSIGFDREIANGVVMGAIYAHQNGRHFIGWKDVGGVYEPQTEVLSDGSEIVLQALVSPPAERFFLLTNPEELFLRYNGLTLTLEKKWSSRWQALVSYTFSDAFGLLPGDPRPGANQTSSSFGGGEYGRDPNDYVNAVGDLNNDRTHMFKTQATFEIPRIGVVVAANFQHVSGQPWGAIQLFRLPQGERRVWIETQGARRLSSQTLLDLRLSKVFRFRNNGRFEILADLLNLTNDSAETGLVTANYASPNFGAPNTFVLPFRAMLGVKLFF